LIIQSAMKVTAPIMKGMGMGRVFKDNEGRINSLDFHHTDNLLVTAGDDNSIRIYNTNTGENSKTLFSKKYGVCCVNFTHHSDALLYASNKGWDNSLRYLSLHDNRYLRYFTGHEEKVTTVSMSPKTDGFMSAGDRTVRLWDLRTAACHGRIEMTDQSAIHTTCAYDKQGLVFAVATNPGVIKLYDARTYGRGPFETFICRNETQCITQLLFSMDGRVLLGAAGGRIHVMDAYYGKPRGVLQTRVEEGQRAMEAAFTPCGEFVVSGCGDRRIRAWRLGGDGETPEECGTWQQQAGMPSVLKWSPTKMLAASGCSMGVLGLWIGA